MLGKPCREKGELEGVGIAPNVKPSTPPNLPLASTLGDYNSHVGKGGGIGSAFADSLIHNATSNVL